jgi:hypothetical protein
LSRLSLPALRRGALLAIGLALVAYFLYLLSDSYRSHSRLRGLAEERVLLDAEKRSTALGYYLSERREDIADLSQSRELLAYFENEALGMSMEYGLAASLEGTKEAFQVFRKRKRLADREIYST